MNPTTTTKALVVDASNGPDGGVPALRVLTLDGRSSLNAKLRDALVANRRERGLWRYGACSRRCVMGLVPEEGDVGTARGTATEELWEFLAGNLSTGEVDDEFDPLGSGVVVDYQITLVGRMVDSPGCYCGAPLSRYDAFGCSDGCDWSGVTADADDVDAALDSGCECGHHRRLRKGKRRRVA